VTAGLLVQNSMFDYMVKSCEVISIGGSVLVPGGIHSLCLLSDTCGVLLTKVVPDNQTLVLCSY